jgi:hypothetical protein
MIQWARAGGLDLRWGVLDHFKELNRVVQTTLSLG